MANKQKVLNFLAQSCCDYGDDRFYTAPAIAVCVGVPKSSVYRSLRSLEAEDVLETFILDPDLVVDSDFY